MEQNMITIRNLSKEFKGQSVLKNITMEIPKNCVYGLLGANGAGKSTLLKTITGLLNPTSGEIYFEGHKWTRADLADIGALIETPPIYENLTAWENMKVRALLSGPWFSGTGGDTLVWLVSDGNGWKVHQTLTLVRSPVIAADLSGNGRKSLIVYRAGGGTRGMWVELDQVQQENDEYLFTTVNDGVKAPDLGTLKGTALFADDMILDQMTGSYKTLG